MLIAALLKVIIKLFDPCVVNTFPWMSQWKNHRNSIPSWHVMLLHLLHPFHRRSDNLHLVILFCSLLPPCLKLVFLLPSYLPYLHVFAPRLLICLFAKLPLSEWKVNYGQRIYPVALPACWLADSHADCFAMWPWACYLKRSEMTETEWRI